METLKDIFGLRVQELHFYQMMARAVVVFFMALVFVRFAGLRTLGKFSAFDHITVLTIGAIMGRSVVARGPFFSFILAVVVIILLHRAMAWLSFKSHKLGKVIKGEPLLLYKNGQLVHKNLNNSMVTKEDLEETLRVILNENSFDKVDEIRLERSGKISIVKKQ